MPSAKLLLAMLVLATLQRTATAAPTDAAPWDGSSDEWQGVAVSLPPAAGSLNGVWARDRDHVRATWPGRWAAVAPSSRAATGAPPGRPRRAAPAHASAAWLPSRRARRWRWARPGPSSAPPTAGRPGLRWPRAPASRSGGLTHEADPTRLAETAADFTQIEGVLEGIAPRRKLLLLDTCESGERDEAAADTSTSGSTPDPALRARAAVPLAGLTSFVRRQVASVTRDRQHPDLERDNRDAALSLPLVRSAEPILTHPDAGCGAGRRPPRGNVQRGSHMHGSAGTLTSRRPF